MLSVLLVFSACEEKITDFENVVEVTPDECKKWGLDEVHFLISYPNDDNILFQEAQEGEDNLSYIMFDYLDKDELSNEEISIGYCTNCKNYDDDGKLELIQQLMEQFESQLPNLEIVSNDTEVIFGEKRVVAKFTFSSEEPIFGYFAAGNYKAMIVEFSKESNTNNGVIIILLANESTGIKEFSDFGEKGNLAKVFKTFRFAE